MLDFFLKFSVLKVIYREIFLCRFVDKGIVSGIKIGEGFNAPSSFNHAQSLAGVLMFEVEEKSLRSSFILQFLEG